MALIDAGDHHHQTCRDTLAALSSPLLSTWPVMTETLFLLDRAAGWQAQKQAWSLVLRDDLILIDLDAEHRRRSAALMERYRDIPMSLADATLVAVAETLRMTRIFTLDADFVIYRYRDRGYFRLLPEPGQHP